MFRRFQSKKLVEKCSLSLSYIRQTIIDASEKVGDNQIAWGQFLDYERSTGQIGVYGTATAVKTLVLLNEPDASDYISHGINWLLDNYSDHESIANRKMDWGVVYKYCYFLESLAPNDSEINDDSRFSDHFRTLIDRKLPNNGWGEYYYSPEYKNSNHSVVATAMALYVLRRYIPFSKSQQGKAASSWFCNKLISATNLSKVELALSIIALREYSQVHDDVSEIFPQLVDRLEQKVKKLGRLSNLSEFPHHFTVPHKEAEKKRNRYIFLPINALVAYSLLITNRYQTAKDYIDITVAMCQDSISVNKAYCNPEESPRKSTVNQFWVTLLLKEYMKIRPVGKIESAFLKLKSRPRLYKISLALITIVIFVVTYFLLKHFQQNQSLSVISLLLFFGVDRILSLIWKSNR